MSIFERYHRHPQEQGQPVSPQEQTNRAFRKDLAQREREVWSNILGTEVALPEPPSYLSEEDAAHFSDKGFQVLFLPQLQVPKNDLGFFDPEAFIAAYPGIDDLATSQETLNQLWDYLISGHQSDLAGSYIALQRSPAQSGKDRGETKGEEAVLTELGLSHLSEDLPVRQLDLPDYVLLSGREDVVLAPRERTKTTGLSYVQHGESRGFTRESAAYDERDTASRMAVQLPSSSFQTIDQVVASRDYWQSSSPEAFLRNHLRGSDEFLTECTERVKEHGLSGTTGLHKKFLNVTLPVVINPLRATAAIGKAQMKEDPLLERYLRTVHDQAYQAGESNGRSEGYSEGSKDANDQWYERTYGPSDPTR